MFIFLLWVTAITQCTFDSFENTILSKTNPFYQKIIQINSDSIYGFAFWTKYIVYNTITVQHQVGEQFDNTLTQDGYLLMSIIDKNTNQNYLITYLKEIGTIYKSYTIHTLLYIQPDGTLGNINMALDTLYYEGYWICNFISLNPSTNSLEYVVYGPKQYSLGYIQSYKNTLSSNQIQSTIGGLGKLSILDTSLNLAGFKGYFSKLIQVDQYFYDVPSVQQYITQSNCDAKNECSQQISYTIIDSVKLFDGEYELHQSIFQTGTNYVIQFWVKLDLSQVNYNSYVFIFRARTNKEYKDYTNLGDRSMLMQYFIDIPNNISTFQFIAGYQYSSPQLSTESSESNGDPSRQFYYYGGEQLLTRIQKWHFVAYCQEVFDQQQIMFVFYPQEWWYYYWNFQYYQIYRQFSNTVVYFDIGVDRFHNQQKFQGQIAKFKFINCVSSDYDYYPECHPICNYCSGPTENDCIYCYSNQNRVYSLDGSTCECINNYIDSGFTNYQCISFDNEYELILSEETRLTENSQDSNCPSTLYLENRINCANCYRNINNWLNQPICNSDLIRFSQLNLFSPFYEITRDENQIELFIQNSSGQLQLCVGCLSICTQNEQDCFWLEFFSKWVKCKPNYFFADNQCNSCPAFCQLCDNTGNCLKCSSHYYLNSKLNQCLQCPIDCNECSLNSLNKQVECLTCFSQQSLFQGKCYRCGQFCGICAFDLINDNDRTEYQINRCLKCIDPSQYFISFDAVNCQKNEIPNCLYAFQYYKPDRQFTTMDFKFQPRPLDNKIGTACAKCQLRNIYYLSDEQNECVYNYQPCEFLFQDPKYDNKVFVIIGEQYYYNCQSSIQQYGSCTYYGYPLVNCRSCIYSYTNSLNKCVSCINHYYSERINGVCIKCELDHCLSCSQQMQENKDGYILQMKAFYEHFVNKDGNHPFEIYAQSQDINDYEVICSYCESGYMLLDNLCVKKCPENCYECEIIDGQAMCLRCFETQQGQALTLHNGECIQCPYNCALCLVRDQSAINGINPYFNSQKYIQFTHLCLKPFDSIESLSYDANTGQYIQCLNYEQCGKQWTIERNIYCSQYEFDLAQIGLDEQQLRKFKQKNILLSQLFSNISGTHIPEIENDIVYLQANKQQISRLILRYIILGDQECNLSGQVQYGQYFSQHVFTLTNVSLELFASQQIPLTYAESITFDNFTSITIKNIIFQEVLTPSQIIFDNLQKTQIQINNCKFISNNQFQIQLHNVTHLEFVNNSIINSQIERVKFNSIFYINSDDSLKLEGNDLIQFRNLLISDSYFFNLQFVEQNTKISFLFENITIQDSQLEYFNFLNLTKIQFSLHSLIIHNCQVKDSQSLFIFNQQDEISFNNLFIDSLNLTNSTFIYSTTDIIIFNGRFTNNLLNESSRFLYIENSNQVQLLIELSNFQFQNISFNKISHLIEIQDDYHVKESQVYFSNLTFYNNSRIDFDDEVQALENAVVLINISSIVMTDIQIHRAFGITEFVYLSTDNVSIQSFTAQLIGLLEIKGLHQHLDCIQKYIDIQSVKPLIRLIEPIDLSMANFTLNNLIVIDEPLIIISQSKSPMGSLILTNWNVTNNLLLTTPSSSNVALFNVKSSLQIEIILQQIIFSENILNQYAIEQASTSSASLSLECSSCTCSITSLTLANNLVTNSSNAIVYLQLKSLSIKTSQFFSNNLLTYKLIKRHLYLGFPSQFQLNYQTIAQLFPVVSSGIIKVTSEYVQLKNVEFSNNFGVKGGSILLTTSSKGLVEIFDSHFVNISMGGNIYIDNALSELNLTIHNIVFEYIFNVGQGSIVTVNPSLNKVLIQIINSQLIGCESLQGNIIAIQQDQYNEHSQITLNNLTVSATQESFKMFLGYFSDFSLLDINNIIEQRYQILVEDITISFHDIEFAGLYFSKVFSSRNSIVSMEKVSISNFQHAFNLITISFEKYFQSIYLADIRILNNVEYNRINSVIDCETGSSNQQQIQMICQINYVQEVDLQIQSSEEMNQCRLKTLLNNDFSFSSLFSLNLQSNTTNSQVLSQIQISNILLFNNTCSSCIDGTFNVYFVNNLYNMRINQLKFHQNNCGNGGCFQLKCDEVSISKYRRLNQILSSLEQSIKIKIKNSYFINNTIQNGGCIMIINSEFVMENTIISNNSGIQTNVSGIQIFGVKPYLLINNQVENNYLWNLKLAEASLNSQQLSLNTLSEISSTPIIPQVPCQLQIKLKKYSVLFKTNRIYYDSRLTIDELNYYQPGLGQQHQYIQLPSGIQISQYAQFQLESVTSIQSNISLTLAPTNQFQQVMNLSSNATCDIKSRKIQLSESKTLETDFTNEDYINLKQVTYSQEYYGFNLDNLIIYFDPDTPQAHVLQLQFHCDSIQTDLFGVDNQYYPQSYQKNYYFRMNVRTIPCQLGEIKNQTTHSCQTCDYSQGFYSISYNATQCFIQNTDYIANITSNNIQIKKGYWRQKYTNPQIELCKNLEENCLGGWTYGDDSCYIGHIGALCEECDLYNIRGQGQYSTDSRYSCGTCQSSSNNIIIFVIISIWTLIQVTITVKATYDFTLQLIQRRYMIRLALILANENCQAGVLMKFLSTYFQIIGSLSSFQLNIPLQLTTFLQTTGNPIQKMIYTLDCIIVNTTSLEIVYTKVIWELLMPLFYMVIFIVFSMLLFIVTKNLQRNGLVITGIVYLFLFFQPNLIGSFISVISYRYVDGIKWVQGNMSYRYDTQTHYQWVYILICFTGFFGMILPSLILYHFYHNRHELNTLRFRKLYGYLYNEFMDSVYFWEIIKLMVKDAIIVILIFYQDVIFMKAILIYLALQVYLLMIYKYRPYRIGYLNDLELSLIYVCQISIIIGFGLYMLNQQQITQPQMSFLVILCFLNLYLLSQLFLKLISAYSDKFQIHLDRIKDFLKNRFPQFFSRNPFLNKIFVNRTKARQRASKNFGKLFRKLQSSGTLSKVKQSEIPGSERFVPLSSVRSRQSEFLPSQYRYEFNSPQRQTELFPLNK